MELSSVSRSTFQNIASSTSLHITPLSFTKTTTRPNTPHLSFATAFPKQAQARPSKAYRSDSYIARQVAVVQIQHSSDFQSAFQRFGGILTVQDLNALLRHFGNLNNWKDLSQLFEWMQIHKKISASSYRSYFKFLGKSSNYVKALEVYNSIEDNPTKNNASVCNSVLSCLVKNGKFDTSIKLFNQMKREGLRPDVVTYSTLLAGCMKVNYGYSKALEFVEELQNNGVRMDCVIYGTLIAICASNKHCKEAENYFKLMKDSGHSPNVYHYSSLLNAYSVYGDYKKADELFHDMKLAGLVPNKVFLTTLLKVYVRGGLFEKSRELLTELEALGYAKDEMPYCLLMDGLAKAGCVHEARAVFNYMKEKDVKSDGYAHSIMISAFCRARLIDEAKQLARDIEEKHEKYDLVLMNTMICAYCRAGEMESVMLILRKMDGLLISPDYNTYHILIKYFCKEQVYMLAYQIMKDMHSKGHQLEEELSSSLISHLGKTRAYLEALSLYNLSKYGKRPINKDLHEKILQILIAGRLLKEAFEIFKENAELLTLPAIKKFAKAFMKFGNINLINDVMITIHGSGYKIDQDLFEMAISRYIDQPDQKELLFELLQWMPGEGYIVDSSTRNLLLKNSHLFGRQLVAKELSKQYTVSKSLNNNLP